MSDPQDQSPQEQGKKTTRWDRFVDAYVEFASRRGVLVAAVGLVVVAVGAAFVPSIRIDPRLEMMLPADTPSQLAVNEARERYANASPLYLAVTSSDPVVNRTVTRELLRRVEEWDEVLWAIDSRDPSFFLDRRLLYLRAEHVDEFADQVSERVDWEECERLPGCVNLDDQPPEPDFEGLRNRYEEIPELSSLVQLLGRSEIPDPDQDANAPPDDGGPGMG
ncbi:MAG: hypothetical protein AAGF12_26435, partial [Myxococcota bacterium]